LDQDADFGNATAGKDDLGTANGQKMQIVAERVALPEEQVPAGKCSERFALELDCPMDREPKTARYTIRRDALGWSVIDAVVSSSAELRR